MGLVVIVATVEKQRPLPYAFHGRSLLIHMVNNTLACFILLLISSLGDVYIADYNNHRIRKVTVSTGVITTIAGKGTGGSFSGDGGAATSAYLNNPFGVVVDSSGSQPYFSLLLPS